MLKSFELCKLDQASRTHKYTALIIACNKKLETVAMKMLEYPELCKLDQVNYNGDTALMMACKKKLETVSMKMLEYPELCKLDQVNNNGDTSLIIAYAYHLVKVAFKIKKYNNQNRKVFPLYRENKCVICLDEVNCYICIPECKHFICMCKKCDTCELNKCTLCNNKIDHDTVISLSIN